MCQIGHPRRVYNSSDTKQPSLEFKSSDGCIFLRLPLPLSTSFIHAGAFSMEGPWLYFLAK